MTPRVKKVLIISISLLAIGGVVGYIFWKKAKDKKDAQIKADADAKAVADANASQGGGSTGSSTGGSTGGSTKPPTLSNFEALQKNLNTKAGKNGVVSVKFNGGKNVADFYNNNRVIIGTFGVSGYLKKGSYSNGGLAFNIDGGKTISSSSVWTNLVNALK
jgi:hypothetical protein